MRIKIEFGSLPISNFQTAPLGRKHKNPLHNYVWIDSYLVILSDLNW